MSKEAFIIHTDTWPAIKTLSAEQKGTLFEALICHQIGEPEPKMDVQTQMAFMFMAAQMDRDNEKYEKVSEKRRDAANARWSKQKMQMHNLHYDTDTETVTDTDTDTETDTDTDTEAPVALPDLSLQERQLLDQEFGQGRVDELIDEVNLWAINHGQMIKNLPAMVRQFAKNQQRWGGRPARREKTIEEIAAEVFKDMEVTT